MSQVFEFVVIRHPGQDEKKKAKQSEIVVPVTTVVAKDVQGATLLAARMIPEQYVDELDNLQVAVRPF